MKSREGSVWGLGRMAGVVLALVLVLAGGMARAQVATTTVAGVVYRADGTPAQGSMQVSWKAFETAQNQAVAAGNKTVVLGSDGYASLNLAPNAGASPAGSYYTVLYHLNDGTVSREYWTVPAAATAAIASVRAQLEPSMVAVQSVSKSYVDQLVSSLAPTAAFYLPLAGGALAGPLTLNGDPSGSTQATTKHYVDQAVATAVPLAGGTVTGMLAAANAVNKLPKVDVRSADFAGGADPTGVRDSTAAVQAAIAFAMGNSPSGEANYPVVYFPAGHYLIHGNLRIPNMIELSGDSRSGAILQETDPQASLITVYNATNCSTYVCYGGVENLTLEGSGKLTNGTLLELDSGFVTLRNLHFYNNGGRGLQMNAAAERVMSYDLSFYQVRWPLIMGGDTNEDYFYNTHIVESGQTHDVASNAFLVGHYCYSVNCTNGLYEAQGTTAGDANAGRGLTITNLHCSEVARWPGEASAVLQGLQAALAPGGELVLESTPQGAQGCFWEQWRRAAETGMVQHFFPWWWEASYVGTAVAEDVLEEEERRLRAEHGLTLEQVGYRRMLRAGYRELAGQEFAEDVESCFAASGDCIFDTAAVDARVLAAPAPVVVKGPLWTWLPPAVGKRYVVAVDPAGGGTGGDYGVAQVVELETGLQCAELRVKMPVRELSEEVARLHREYNLAWVVVERNNHGAGVLAHLESMVGPARVYMQNGWPGWLTSSVSRPGMLAGLGALLVERPELFMSERMLRECRGFVRLANGRTGAQSGEHDDCVMAMAIAQAVRGELLGRR